MHGRGVEERDPSTALRFAPACAAARQAGGMTGTALSFRAKRSAGLRQAGRVVAEMGSGAALACATGLPEPDMFVPAFAGHGLHRMGPCVSWRMHGAGETEATQFVFCFHVRASVL
jgi:hypothetical protein